MKFLGIDFSGAKDAGRKIWIAEGEESGSALSIEALRPVTKLPDGARERDKALRTLRGYIGGLGPAIVGIDAPNSLPRDFMPQGWAAWLAGLSSQHRTPQCFRTACRDHWLRKTGRKEGRRACDRDARTPFSAWNERLYRQTWQVLTAVYAPLVADDRITVAPFQPPDFAKPRLAEICPASTLKALKLYEPGYKGSSTGQAERRAQVLMTIAKRAGLRIPADLRQLAVADSEGDALDALVALLAAYRCRDLIARHNPVSEGIVYVWA